LVETPVEEHEISTVIDIEALGFDLSFWHIFKTNYEGVLIAHVIHPLITRPLSQPGWFSISDFWIFLEETPSVIQQVPN
jgi:hypothetical protein